MNIEQIREYCLSLPLATEDFPFDETTLVFRIAGHIFAMTDLETNEWITLKCEPEHAQELRAQYPEIEGAWHMNKKYWNQVNYQSLLDDELIKRLIRHSYQQVVRKLPKSVRTQTPAITEIQE
ncbi:MAG: MmcQ/YjbR family DNA-binding protein [Prevotella sp.]